MNHTQKKRRYAICGLSLRGIRHFLLPLLGKTGVAGGDDFSNDSEVVGIYDIDPERCAEFLKKHDLSIPCFSPADGIDEMVKRTRPDVLLVAGPDHTHCEHILAGLRHGLDVITEKPVVINSAQAQAVLRAEQDSPGRLIVTHNLRYGYTMRRVKEFLLSGRLGRITNIEFVHNLDTRHGASYFARWNRERRNSGGLSVHKCVHDMDILNWLIQSVPETVFGFGALNYYGKGGHHRPRPENGVPLSVEQTKAACPYFQQNFASKGIAPSDPAFRLGDDTGLPFSAQYPEQHYIYDDAIDIEDTYSAVIRYRNGATATYSCNFSTPWEGYTIGINGTGGRLEIVHRSTPNPAGGIPIRSRRDTMTFMPLFGGLEEHLIEVPVGGHGGADTLIRSDIFLAPCETSKMLNLVANALEGAMAVAAGEAIWRSNAEARPFDLRELMGEFYGPAPSPQPARFDSSSK